MIQASAFTGKNPQKIMQTKESKRQKLLTEEKMIP